MKIVRRRRTLADVREECREFEERYGVPTERLEDAFGGESLCEDEDFSRWSLLRSALRLAERRAL